MPTTVSSIRSSRRLLAGLCAVALAAGLYRLPAAYGQAQGRAIFVANNGNLEGSVTAFTVNPDGTLALVNRVITGSRPSTSVPCPGCNPYEISLTPNGRYLATGHASTNDPYEQITIFEVAADASITQIGAYSVPGTPMDVAWIDNELLAAERTDSDQVAVYRFDPAGPFLTEVDVKYAGGFSTYLALHPSRSYLYVSDSGSSPYSIRVFRVDAGGALTLVETETTGSSYPLELALSHDGTKLYAAGGITHVVLGFHVAPDGTLTPMTGSPFPEFGSSPSNVAVGTDDKYLLVGHGTDATLRSAAINPTTGALTYTGNMFDVGLQGTLGDVQTLDDLFFVTDNSTAIDGVMGVYSFTLNADGSFTQHGPITWTDGIAPRSVATWRGWTLRGDLNCDGVVNFADINPFVLALSGYDAYHAQYPHCYWLDADCNGDGDVNFADINPFVALLSSGN